MNYNKCYTQVEWRRLATYQPEELDKDYLVTVMDCDTKIRNTSLCHIDKDGVWQGVPSNTNVIAWSEVPYSYWREV